MSDGEPTVRIWDMTLGAAFILVAQLIFKWMLMG